MCGICGFVNLDGAPAQSDILKRMSDKIVHRGPDESGQLIYKNIALGSQRLSIIDLQGGRQPIHNETESCWIVYNGEVYNFQELGEKLLKKHTFYTRTDTEVIVHLWEEMRHDCVQYLNGMFAFAIYDKKNEELFIARDRIGKKPLYYSNSDKFFVFGSEAKSLLQHPGTRHELDMQSINKYFIYEYVPSPHTVFKTIKKLPPGHFITLSRSEFKIKQYHKYRFGYRDTTIDEAVPHIKELLHKSVKRRLISDVPLGLFLSSGVDSSTVLAYMSQHIPRSDIKTFSIGFETPDFDESREAKKTADFFETSHSEKIFDTTELIETINEISKFMDEPFADPSILPTFLLSKFTRQHVKVALSGDGGDELFFGYPTFTASFLSRLFMPFPKALVSEFSSIANLIPTSFGNISTDYKIKQFFKGLLYNEKVRNQIWIGAFRPDEIKNLIPHNLSAEELLEDIHIAFKSTRLNNSMDGTDFFYFRFYLSDDVLCKVDRASMACSLEVRSPLLDDELVEFVTSLKIKHRFKPFDLKFLLKKAADGMVPRWILNRRKRGFAIPVARFLADEAKPLLLNTLSKERIKRHSLFNYHFIEKLINEHLTHKQDNRRKLFALMMFQLWFENYA